MNGVLALALTAGVLAPVNPCGFALLPAWITHTLADHRHAALPIRLARAARAGLTLTLGFAGTLTAAGLAVSVGARALITAAPWLGLATGIVLLLLGVLMLTGRSLGPHLRLSTTDLRPAARPATTGHLVLFGVGYAAASLSCTFGVLLAVIAQAQATASYGGLLAVFGAYAAGSAALLLLVSISTAAAGAALTRPLRTLARHGTHITAIVLTLTGAYLAWYWWPATSGHTGSPNALAGPAATTSTWLQTHTAVVLASSGAAALTISAAALTHRLRGTRHTEPKAIAIQQLSRHDHHGAATTGDTTGQRTG